MSAATVGIREASERLGLHYMTVYRHVRTGRLEAVQAGGEWRIPVGALERARRRRTPSRGRHATASRRAVGSGATPSAATPSAATPSAATPRTATPRAVSRLAARLVAGDEAGAWQLLDEELASGRAPAAVHLELVCPAMADVGERWALGALDVADEHRATAVAERLVGRLGPRFRPRGRRRGTVVLGAVAGDRHALPSAVIGDLLRAVGLQVVDLGADVPPTSFARATAAVDGLQTVGIVVSARGHARQLRATVDAVRAAAPGATVVVGGGATTARLAREAGADVHTRSASEALAALAAGATPRRAAAPRGGAARRAS